ncbi:hypothetical protein [Rathayibacter sp. AY1A7]|uniref:hypothetical protein n=1 Tax=Rathayibacter sp. AY1A7 TaxID=2080524 RepID=UPI000D4CFCF6|nr:hypothetical protein [Rathayibacter sp. AY1A7]PPF18972.1 hypothetical protein C5B95_10615 [Rathayibacter sp. AY1A7]
MLVECLHQSCDVFTTLTVAEVKELVERYVPTSNSQTRLRHHVQGRPDFAVSGDAYMPRVAQRFLHDLTRDGLVQVVLPRCLSCGDARLLTKTLADGRRVCGRCEGAAGRRECAGCGRHRTIMARAAEGGICSSCWRHRPEARKICSRCNRPGLIQERTIDGPVCARCAAGTVLPCSRCGQTAKITGYLLGGAHCLRCYNQIRRVPLPCRTCGESRIIAYLDPAGEPCCASCAGVPARFSCRECGGETDLIGRLCAPCAVQARSLTLITRDDGTVNEVFQPLRDYLIASHRSHTLAAWTTRSASAALIRDLVNDRLTLNHDSLDRATPRRAVDYVRDLLVAVGLLPGRDERLVRAERRVHAAIDAASVEHRPLLRRYATWEIINDLRRRAARSPLSVSAASRAHQKIEAADRFLRHLAHSDTDLGSVRQSQLEQFVLDERMDQSALSAFLRWAHGARLLGDVELVIRQPTTPSPGQTQTELLAAITTLCEDGRIPLRARVAGLLVALFGQRLTHLVTLTRAQIDVSELHNSVSIRLGDEPVRLPPVLAQLTLELRDAPRPWLEDPGQGWLFPSMKAGQPVQPSTLGSELKRHSFSAARLRSAARFNLAGKIPLGPLEELTGIGAQSLNRWATTAQRDWSAYIPLRTEPRSQPMNAPHGVAEGKAEPEGRAQERKRP